MKLIDWFDYQALNAEDAILLMALIENRALGQRKVLFCLQTTSSCEFLRKYLLYDFVFFVITAKNFPP